MKNLLLTLSAAVVLLSACKSEKKSDLDIDKNIVFSDTSTLKQGNNSTDVAATGTTAPVAAPTPVSQPQQRPQTITKVIHVYEKQPAPKPTTVETPPIIAAPAPTTTTTGTGSTAGTGTVPDVITAPAPVPVKKNTGWSSAAKGAVIGGVGGAVAGAVIGKGGKGAIIGGVVGAAGGYILGKKADKKSGRTDTTIRP